MIEIDTSRFRDPGYKEQMDSLMKQLAEIEADGSFIAYASNRDLLNNLETLLEENRRRYRHDYLANFQAFQALRQELSDQEENLHAVHHAILQNQLEAIEEKVTSFSYDTNAAAGPELKALTTELANHLEQFSQFQEGYKLYKARLEFLTAQIWQEKYEQLSQPLKALADPQALPHADIWQWPEDEVQTAIAERKAAFSSLLQATKGRKRLTKQILATESKPISKADFELFQQKIFRRIKGGNTRGYVLVGVSLALVLVGLWFAPSIMAYFNEEQVWEESLQTDTWTAYQQYLHDYPDGKYRALAKERQMLLDYGKIENIVTDEGRVYSYEGELDAGRAHGQGIATFANGDHYEGSWRAGSFWGQGSMTYADGSSYAGEWEANRFHGNGTLQKADGSIYTGGWKQGRQEGQGSLIFADGSKYLGSWKEGLPDGNGTFSATEKESTLAFGRSWHAGDLYSGAWKAGKPDGTGTLRYGNGQIYQGKWMEGLRHGQGKMTFEGNSYFEGSWRGDTINGEGIFISRFREETRGIWKGSPRNVRKLDKYGILSQTGKFENGLFIKE